MMTINKISEFNFDKVPIDAFWNTSDIKEQKIHRIHAYPAKFPAFITTKALQYVSETSKSQPRRIADIFCGCGTTAIEARRNSIDFWGCDINPIATLIAKVKSKKYQSNRLQKYYNHILSAFNNNRINDEYKLAPERLKYWFYKKQYNDLNHLKKVILKTTPNRSHYRMFFLCCFSNILKATSRWLTKSIKPHLDPNKRAKDVLKAFKEQFNFMFLANSSLEKLSDSQSIIKTGNFLETNWEIPDIDMVITSPPYVTSYEYADLHQLSTLWLDYVKDYRDLRNGTIGSVYHDYDFTSGFQSLNNTGQKIVTHLLNEDKSKAKSVAKYFIDMQNAIKKIFSILTINGIAIFVIGNTEYKNIRINNAKHLSEALYDTGFMEIQVTKRKISNKILTPYRDDKGKFTTNSNGRKVYSEEFIIIGRKNQ